MIGPSWKLVFVDGRQVVADGVVHFDINDDIEMLRKAQTEAVAAAAQRDWASRGLGARSVLGCFPYARETGWGLGAEPASGTVEDNRAATNRHVAPRTVQDFLWACGQHVSKSRHLQPVREQAYHSSCRPCQRVCPEVSERRDGLGN